MDTAPRAPHAVFQNMNVDPSCWPAFAPARKDAPQRVVYGFTDPRTNELRYIGKSIHLANRLYGHVRGALFREKNPLLKQTYLHNWWESLTVAGVKPSVFVIETAPSDDALDEAERFWIGYMRSLGCRLANGTMGGDGQRSAPGVGARISAAKKGIPAKPFSAATRLKISIANKGKTISEEAKRKASITKKAWVATPEGRALMAKTIAISANARRGQKRTALHVIKDRDAWRSKISATLKAKGITPPMCGMKQVRDSNGNVFTSQSAAGAFYGVTGAAVRAAMRRNGPLKGGAVFYPAEAT